MLSWILLPILLLLTVFTIYLCVLTISALLFAKRFHPIPKALTVGVVIPAHNEETVLEDALKSIGKVNYPKDQIKVFLIADNCDDRTAEIGRAYKAQVFERSDTTQLGKGHALQWFFTHHQASYEDLDCLFLIDADTVVDRNCIQEIVSTLSHPGTRAVQAYYTVGNPEASWMTALSYIGFILFNHVRTAGSSFLGSTAGLRGNGMGFRTELIKRYGWPCYSLAEDLEFTVRLLQEGICVDYNPDAIVYTEMPETAGQADSQRRRWEKGRFVLIKQYFASLLDCAIRTQSGAHLELLLGLVTPPLAITVLLLLSMWSFAALGVLSTWFVYLLIFNTLAITGYVFAGLLMRRTPLAVWRSLLMVPGFLVFKAILYAKMLFEKRDDTWVRTQRNKELS